MPAYTFTFPAAAAGLPYAVTNGAGTQVETGTLGNPADVQGPIVVTETLPADDTYEATAVNAPVYASFRSPGVLDVEATMVALDAADERLNVLEAATQPNASSWPIYSYGASYSTLGQSFFTAGNHWTQILAGKVGAGAVTSYGVNGRRCLDITNHLLQGVGMSGISGIVAGSKWPGTSSRSGLIVHDALGNDIINQAAMNGGSITAVAISGTDYLNYLKQHYRAALALMSSSGTRVENHSHTATNGTWTHSSAGTWASGGDTCFTTANGAYAEYSVTPPQRGPLAGKVYVIVAGDIPTNLFYADLTTSVDGGSASAAQVTYRHTYTGTNGTQVKGVVNAIPVTVPVDGAAHTIRVTHAGTGGHYAIVDCILVPSEDPNPILCMGVEHAVVANAAALDATDVAIYKANEIKVRAAYKEVVAEFPNAIYVPSTVTTNGLWSSDGLHLNDRGNLQRANDAEAAVRAIKPRLDNRAASLAADADFGIV